MLLAGLPQQTQVSAELLLLERHAAGGHAGHFLELLLAGLVAAPHRLDKAGCARWQSRLISSRVRRVIGRALAVFQRTADTCRRAPPAAARRPCVFQLVQRDKGLFPVVAAHQHALVLLDVLRADLQAQRNALHLVLGKLPAGGVVGDRPCLTRNCLGQALRAAPVPFRGRPPCAGRPG